MNNQTIDITKLRKSYYEIKPDPSNKDQSVAFGTSGHRGSSLFGTFNQMHIEAIVQAIVDYRKEANINGEIFLGMDSHALSLPAIISTIEVLAANEVSFYVDKNLNFDDKGGFTPTPVVSFSILENNKKFQNNLSDGIIITPSHNPPEDGGIKYNPPTGGPAESAITKWIEKKANNYILENNDKVKKIPFEKALKSHFVKRYNYIDYYVDALSQIINFDIIKSTNPKIGVDPMGGSTKEIIEPIAQKYKINLQVANPIIDLTFSFMPKDKDGKIRMDCSSPYAMKNLIKLKNEFDIAWGNDTDGDRHGIVTKKSGLLSANQFLAVAINYLIQNRKNWANEYMIGKTIVSSSLIDKIAHSFNKKIYETPVGFKHFVKPLLEQKIVFAGEESAGATFLRKNGSVWTTDKDGIIMGLLAAEIFSYIGRDLGDLYFDLTNSFGTSFYTRIDTPASKQTKEKLKKISSADLQTKELAGEKIENIITVASNNEPIDGIKVITKNGWFAIRPSGTEDIAKLYAESFISEQHLQQIIFEAKSLMSKI